MRSMARAAATPGLALWLVIVLGAAWPAAQAADYSFDLAEIEKKAFEWGGYVEAKQEYLQLRPDSPLYPFNFPGAAPRETLNRSTGTLELAAKWQGGPLTADLRWRAAAAHDEMFDVHAQALYEGGLHWALDTNWALDVGKRVQRWGKGYAWNPVAFVERPKDANDPQQSREGYAMIGGEWVRSFDGAWGGALSAASVTALLVPVTGDLNDDYGPPEHVNPALKVSALVHDTDVDFLWAGAGSRPARWGVDFSRNLGAQLEVHGEWARAYGLRRPLVQPGGAIVQQQIDPISWLLGLRYITEREVTWFAELYRNGAGYTDDEYAAFLQAAAGATPPRVATLAQTAYLRANPGRDYAQLRIVGKEPFDWLYSAPALTLIVNLQDRSFSLTPELVYTGVENIELRARWVWLQGSDLSEFGARPVRSRLEAYARWSF